MRDFAAHIPAAESFLPPLRTSYGFVLASNPYGCLDYWVRVPPTDPGFQWKQALLDGHALTEGQAYDFSGTVRAGGVFVA